MKFLLSQHQAATCLPIILASGFFWVAGCTTKSKAQLREREAFVAGQQQAIAQWQVQQSPDIVITGKVNKSMVPWVEGMTVSQAILEAEYIGKRDPREIVILRRGQFIPVNVRNLLKGHDHYLEAGDRIEIRD